MTSKAASSKSSGGKARPAGHTPPHRPGPSSAPTVTPAIQAKIQQICGGLDQLMEDTSVPRNIRRGAEKAKTVLLDNATAIDVRKSTAINVLDELANDPNIPLHGRTLIWSIMSQLEPLA